MRIGAISTLTIRNIDDTKITVYENDKEEYFTFVTRECKQAIYSYIDIRSRYGEKITDDSFLIREQFDIRDKIAISKCKGIGRNVLQWKLSDNARRQSENEIWEQIEKEESRKKINLTKIRYNLKLQQNIPMLNKELKALQPKLISYTKIIL
jgi:hypothetical protein